MTRADKLKPAEPCIEVPEERWREIEASIGIQEPNHPFRRCLAHRIDLALDPYSHRSFGQVGGPRIANVKKRISKLNKDAQRLAETLSKLHHDAESGDKNADMALYLTVQCWGELIHKDYPDLWRALAPEDCLSGFPEEWEKLALSTVLGLVEASEIAPLSLPESKGGAPVSARRDEVICALALVYRDETGKKPSVTWRDCDQQYSGRFLKFLHACFRAFVPQYAKKKDQVLGKENSAFGKSVQRALKKLPVNM